MPANFADRLEAAIASRGTPAMVGIDPVLERLPAALAPRERSLSAAVRAIEAFSRRLIELVAPRVAAVKINSGFFEAYYEFGVAAYFRLVEFAHQHGLLVIGDIKRGDIGSTAHLYALGHVAAPAFADASSARIPDAVTLSGYLGHSGVYEFIRAAAAAGRGVYVLVRPSDPTADVIHQFGGADPLYHHLSQLVNEWAGQPELLGAGGLSCVGAVIAPKDVASTKALRANMPHCPFLVPGYGAQGAALDALRECFRADGRGAVVNASRSVIYAFAEPRFAGRDWEAAVDSACADFAAEMGALARQHQQAACR